MAVGCVVVLKRRSIEAIARLLKPPGIKFVNLAVAVFIFPGYEHKDFLDDGKAD